MAIEKKSFWTVRLPVLSFGFVHMAVCASSDLFAFVLEQIFNVVPFGICLELEFEIHWLETMAAPNVWLLNGTNSAISAVSSAAESSAGLIWLGQQFA